MSLFDTLTPTPDLTTYDLILVNTSAGKDSQASMDVVFHAAREAGVANRLVAVHADLGERIEWPGTKELAAEHAAAEARMIERAATPAPGAKAKQPRFRNDLSMADIIAAAERETVGTIPDWNA